MTFKNGKLCTLSIPAKTAAQVMLTGKPFRTSGCPNCNRPYYNERPGGHMYNFAAPLNSNDINLALDQLESYVKVEIAS
jgi:biotin synthase